MAPLTRSLCVGLLLFLPVQDPPAPKTCGQFNRCKGPGSKEKIYEPATTDRPPSSK